MKKISIIYGLTLAAMGLTGTIFGEETVVFQPGCLAKVYVCGKYPANYELTWDKFKGDVPEWPIKVLPDAPAEVLKLREVPIVEATTLDEIYNKKKAPSYLVESKTGILRGVNYYAVEFEGYYQSPVDGIYTVAINSDDPVQCYVEGKVICESTFSASPVEGPSQTGDPAFWGRGELTDQPKLIPSTASVQGSIRLAPNKYYHIVVLAKQRWYPAYAAGYPGYNGTITTTDLNRGAVFKATITTPDNKTGPLVLQLPVVK